MSKTVVQMNFEYHMPQAEYETIVEQAAPSIAQVEGIVWKIFIIKEATQEAGGLYLFESVAAAEAYLNGPIITGLRQHPGIRNVSVKLFNFLEIPTLVTHGPVELPVRLET
jgi:hypothetical protein